MGQLVTQVPSRRKLFAGQLVQLRLLGWLQVTQGGGQDSHVLVSKLGNLAEGQPEPQYPPSRKYPAEQAMQVEFVESAHESQPK